ncbi:MAG: hypothetical protein IPN72_22260 [Saprospiraceae bacterium]|nr:hypothetical protein [Saprospiraceae bacterium]
MNRKNIGSIEKPEYVLIDFEDVKNQIKIDFARYESEVLFPILNEDYQLFTIFIEFLKFGNLENPQPFIQYFSDLVEDEMPSYWVTLDPFIERSNIEVYKKLCTKLNDFISEKNLIIQEKWNES